jgi:uroporphyrinogen decarboxylase
MTGKQRIAKAFALEETDRTPWTPFVGCHGGKLIDVDARTYLTDPEMIVRGVEKAVQLYQPDGLPVMFDLQVEAEALGCALNWAKDNPPAVTGHPLEGGAGSVDDLAVPGPDAGRIGLCIEAARKLRAAHDDIALYGLITGPFTLALHLLGTEIFMEMFDAPEKVQRLMTFCRDVGMAMSDYYLDAGCDVIAVVDPMTSQIGPDQFRQFVTPFALDIFSHVRQAGGLSSFFVCGHAQQNIEAMCECRPDNVSVDENIPLDFVRDTCLPRGISFGGNMQLTTVLLLGEPEDAKRNAVECMEIGGPKGFILAPGCDLPYATPPENLQGVSQVLGDEYEQQAVKALAETRTQQTLLDMQDYGQSDNVIVDVITLDSEACAPCQYMCEAVRAIAPEFEGIVEWREHKIKYRESLVFMTSLMVRNIPTICIDGKITFVSRIPKREELVAAIQRRIYEKLRVKIRRRRATIYILGDGGDEFQALKSNTRQAITELGLDVAVNEVTDENQIVQFGLTPQQTPAAVVARYRVRSTVHVPEVAIIKEWLKDLE